MASADNDDHLKSPQGFVLFLIAADTPPRFLFCSSTASVLGHHKKSSIPESISHDPHSASPLGYSRSKWVAEAICEQAYYRTPLQGNITVLWIGQLCGDTENGIWNASEAWPLMLPSVKVLKALPDLRQNLDWLPVDTAAEAVIEIALKTTTMACQCPCQHRK